MLIQWSRNYSVPSSTHCAESASRSSTGEKQPTCLFAIDWRSRTCDRNHATKFDLGLFCVI